jgi:SPP1 family predicted phage head-tail adaptor
MPSIAAAGARTKLVTIQQMTETVGPSGRPVETWIRLCDCWMKRDDSAGDEAFQNEGLNSRYDTRWTMPYQANMDPERLNVPKYRRLTYAGRIYDIVTAAPVGLNQQIALMTIAKG